MERGYFITGIGTGVGKTIVSAILCEALEADYWKPIQCGSLEDSDSMKVRSLVSNPNTVIHPEKYLLKEPISPHAAAKRENKKISIHDFELPQTDNRLLVEGAGGIMVPLNDSGENMSDLAIYLKLPVIVVSYFYLGSINHTCMTLEYLLNRGIKVEKLVFSGNPNPDTIQIIKNQYSIPEINITDMSSITPGIIKKTALAVKQSW